MKSNICTRLTDLKEDIDTIDEIITTGKESNFDEAINVSFEVSKEAPQDANEDIGSSIFFIMAGMTGISLVLFYVKIQIMIL